MACPSPSISVRRPAGRLRHRGTRRNVGRSRVSAGRLGRAELGDDIRVTAGRLRRLRFLERSCLGFPQRTRPVNINERRHRTHHLHARRHALSFRRLRHVEEPYQTSLHGRHIGHIDVAVPCRQCRGCRQNTDQGQQVLDNPHRSAPRSDVRARESECQHLDPRNVRSLTSGRVDAKPDTRNN